MEVPSLRETISVLAVDKDGDSLDYLTSSLRMSGFEVSAGAVSGSEALLKASESPPDISIISLSIEGDIDGVETGRQLGAGLGVPVVYIIEHEDPELLNRAMTTGPYGFLRLPLHPPSIRSVIELSLTLHRSEQRREGSISMLQEALECTEEGVLVTDPGGAVVYSNRAAEQLTGHANPESASMGIGEVLDIVHPETLEAIELDYPSLLAQGYESDSDGGRTALRSRGGDTTEVSLTLNPRMDDEGNHAGAVVCLEPRRTAARGDAGAEAPSADEVLLMKELVDSSELAAIALAADGTIRYASPSLCMVLGYTAEEVTGLNISRLLNRPDIDVRSLAGDVDISFRHKGFSERRMTGSGRMVALGSGELMTVITF